MTFLNYCYNGTQAEHDSPSPFDICEGVVDEVRHQDAHSDAQLVEGHQHAALLGRGDF